MTQDRAHPTGACVYDVVMTTDSSRPDVRPFRALRFAPAAGDPSALISPPYDVISRERQGELLARDPHNIVRLELPEGDGDARYVATATALADWRTRGVLTRDPHPALYLHDQTFEHQGTKQTRRGFFAVVRLEAETGRVKPHEKTLATPRGDRMEMLRRLRLQVSPVLAMYRATAPLVAPTRRPDLEATADGQEHRLWALTEADAIARTLATLAGPLYIADGHHRYAAALAYRDEARATGDAAECFVLMELCPADGLLVLPTHRLVASASVPGDLRTRLERFFTIEDLGDAPTSEVVRRLADAGETATSFAVIGLEPGRTHLLRARDRQVLDAVFPAGRSAAWRGLDVAALDHAVLRTCLDLGEDAVTAGALRYVKDADEARREVAGGKAGLAFLLNPTRVEQVLAVADASELMPQKSTWFEPKLPTGLVLYPYD